MPLDLPELSTIDLDGPVRYRAWDGPTEATFVLIHGLGGSHLNWVQVAPGLAGLGRVLAIDLPGFGTSPRAGRGSRLMDERRVLSRLIQELGSGHLIVCGNSMGGAIGILQAAVEPSTVAGLVLTSSVMPWVRGGFPHPAVMAAFALYDLAGAGERLIRARMQRMSPEHVVRLGYRMVAVDPDAIPDDIVQLSVELVRERQHDPDAPDAFLEAARSMLRLGKRPDLIDRAMGGVRCPVLVLHGRRDRFVPAAFAEAALREHPAWRGRIFPDLGHAPQMEAPGRWLTEVADWYAELVDSQEPGTVTARFVPNSFEPPAGLATPDFVLEPLGPQHNERDHAAWSSSLEHIHATPGYIGREHEDPWPYPMSPSENLQDLERHAADFAARRGFAYTVLDPADKDVIGCVYLYPSEGNQHDVRVQSWVRASRAELDVVLWRSVTDWLVTDWPFANPDYDARAES